jgi:hypothetical protein
MKFVTIIQTSANGFEVKTFEGSTQNAIYPQTSEVGLTIACYPITEKNIAYYEKRCLELNAGSN